MTNQAPPKTWMNLKCILLNEKGETEKLYDSNYMTFWNRQNYR